MTMEGWYWIMHSQSKRFGMDCLYVRFTNQYNVVFCEKNVFFQVMYIFVFVGLKIHFRILAVSLNKNKVKIRELEWIARLSDSWMGVRVFSWKQVLKWLTYLLSVGFKNQFCKSSCLLDLSVCSSQECMHALAVPCCLLQCVAELCFFCEFFRRKTKCWKPRTSTAIGSWNHFRTAGLLQSPHHTGNRIRRRSQSQWQTSQPVTKPVPMKINGKQRKRKRFAVLFFPLDCWFWGEWSNHSSRMLYLGLSSDCYIELIVMSSLS